LTAPSTSSSRSTPSRPTPTSRGRAPTSSLSPGLRPPGPITTSSRWPSEPVARSGI
jgi:hypothetical protein